MDVARPAVGAEACGAPVALEMGHINKGQRGSGEGGWGIWRGIMLSLLEMIC